MRLDALTKASQEVSDMLASLADRSPRCAMNPGDPSMTVMGARKRFLAAMVLIEGAVQTLDEVAVPMAPPKAKAKKSKK